jgi:hypothetical protein
MLSSHCIKTHSQKQFTKALSSGEPELNGIAKAATVGIGIKSLMEDLGLRVEVHVNTDPSAPRSISSRGGAGRVRRVEVRELCLQEKVRKGELSIVKAKEEDNVADGLIKHVDRSKLEST